jgi:O-antigen/teichoic acid export membrane protein
MTTKVVKGSLWTLAGQVVPLAVSMLATPFTIRLLGSDGYGVLVLITLIPTYLGFADFGMGLASTKFASEAYARGDFKKEASIVRTAALIALCASAPFAIALFVLSGWLVMVFNVPERLYEDASLALRIASVTIVINFLNQILNTPQLTRLRMDLNTFINASFRIIGIIATPVVIFLGFGVVGAAIVLLVASLLTLAGHLFVSRHLTSVLFGTALDLPSTSLMLRFGGALVISSIAAILLMNMEKGILSANVSVSALAYYSVSFTVASMLTMFTASMTQSLFPAFSRLQSAENREQLQSLFSRSIKMNLIWVAPALVLLGMIARPFFAVWAGEEFARESVVPFYILLAGLAFNILAYLPHSAIMASGRTDIFLKLYWVELIPYALVVWLLTLRWGIVGAAIAWSMRVITDAAILFYIARRAAGVSISISALGRFTGAAAIMLAPLVLTIFLGELNLLLLLLASGCICIYAVMVWKTVLERDEISWVAKRLERLYR